MDGDILAYCRSAYCAVSFEAVKLLRACGYRVSRLSEGLPEGEPRGQR